MCEQDVNRDEVKVTRWLGSVGGKVKRSGLYVKSVAYRFSVFESE